MILKIQDATGDSILIDCQPNWKLGTLLDNYKQKYKSKHPNQSIRSISFSYAGDFFTEDDSNQTLDDIGFQDGELIVFSVLYNGGLI